MWHASFVPQALKFRVTALAGIGIDGGEDLDDGFREPGGQCAVGVEEFLPLLLGGAGGALR